MGSKLAHQAEPKRVGKKSFTCQNCGVIFEEYERTEERKYCSMGCFHSAHRIDTKCNFCGKSVKRIKSAYKGVAYCNNSCRHADKRGGYLLNDELKKEILVCIKIQGFTYNEIKELYGVSHTEVAKICKLKISQS